MFLQTRIEDEFIIVDYETKKVRSSKGAFDNEQLVSAFYYLELKYKDQCKVKMLTAFSKTKKGIALKKGFEKV